MNKQADWNFVTTHGDYTETVRGFVDENVNVAVWFRIYKTRRVGNVEVAF